MRVRKSGKSRLQGLQDFESANWFVAQEVRMFTWATALFAVSLLAEALGFAGLAIAAAILAKAIAVALAVLMLILIIAGPSSVDSILGPYSRPILT